VTDVFLSYHKADTAVAELLAKALINERLTVYWDRREVILNGKNYPGSRTNLLAKLKESKCLLVLWSRTSVHSSGVIEETDSASPHALVAARLHDVEPPHPPVVQVEINTVDLIGWDGTAGDPRFVALHNAIHYQMRLAVDPQAAMRRPSQAANAGAPAGGWPPQTSLPAATSIFICYRRDDTQDAVDRLHERLVQTYGRDRVFIDIDSVPLGVNFVSFIEEQLQRCAVVLVMIGKNWVKLTNELGERRLNDPADHVRLEIAAALSQGVPVIPLLVQDAQMPRAKDLPEDIRQFAFQNGMALPRQFWVESVERLLKELKTVIK
jgi:hypothetical protein